MNVSAPGHSLHRPARWALLLAFGALYLSWGTTFLAIKKGVEAFPPCLFSGSRIALAGLILFAYLGLRGRSLRLPRREIGWMALIGGLLFVGGNGMLTAGEKSVPSGAASVLVAATPLWLAVLELLWPQGDRLTARGWLGLIAGLTGVLVLLTPKLHDPATLSHDAGLWLILGSPIAWSIGSLIVRHRRSPADHLTAAAFQMVLGGVGLLFLGVVLGESAAVERQAFTLAAVYSFFHLLVFGSLIGFVAYNWLLGHVSATLASTYAYVTPALAILAGWALGGESITGWVVGGLAIILTGVALVRYGIRPGEKRAACASGSTIRDPSSVVAASRTSGLVQPVER
jgi:drug/metabolite transporter (DMT)-like permease